MIMFWATLLAVSILLYVLLDGFDLGVGILSGMTRSETKRSAMLAAVAPIWDGNETWLVVTAVILWGAFPVAYAGLLSAFYLPLLVMLAGLILRGVAFEYRSKTERMRWIWDLSFAGGSFAATFIQGLTVGALVEGLPWAVNTSAAISAGSPLMRRSAVSDCVSVMHFLVLLGWLRNVKVTSERWPIGSYPICPPGCSYF
jgi:cytochrome d oxidase subunit CydB